MNTAQTTQLINHTMVRVNEDRSTIYRLSEFIANKFNVTLESMRGRFPGDRSRVYLIPRQLSIYFYLDYYGNIMSLKQIGIFFGGRDHTSMINSRDQIKDLLDSDKQFARFVNEEIYPELIEYLEGKTKIKD